MIHSSERETMFPEAEQMLLPSVWLCLTCANLGAASWPACGLVRVALHCWVQGDHFLDVTWGPVVGALLGLSGPVQACFTGGEGQKCVSQRQLWRHSGKWLDCEEWSNYSIMWLARWGVGLSRTGAVIIWEAWGARCERPVRGETGKTKRRWLEQLWRKEQLSCFWLWQLEMRAPLSKTGRPGKSTRFYF